MLPNYLTDLQSVPGYLTWYVEQRDFMNRVALYLLHRPPENGGRVSHIGKPVVFEMQPYEYNLRAPDAPTIELHSGAAKSLMNELWRIGVRPDGITEVPRPEIDALRAHLTDMRELVFRTPILTTLAAPLLPPPGGIKK